MNTAALANFLRHLLFLLVILKTINGIILMGRTRQCESIFYHHELIPWNSPVPRHAIYLLVQFFSTFGNSFGFLIFIVSLTGFVGAIYLYTLPTVNFAVRNVPRELRDAKPFVQVGMSFLFLVPGEFTTAAVMTSMSTAFEKMIAVETIKLFNTSNGVNRTLLPPDALDRENMETFKTPVINGWSEIARGTPQNHSAIDYIQYSMNCCGATGRLFWHIRVPSSCCSLDYPGEKCVLSRAYPTRCLASFYQFDNCLLNIKVECVVFGFISMATAFVSLYLARLVAKHPQGKFTSETSSASEETSF